MLASSARSQLSTRPSTDIIKTNGWPADYVDSIERVCVLLDRHGEAEMPRIRAGVLEARGLAFAAGQIRRAVARVEQGS